LIGRILGLIKSYYRVWLNMMTSSEGPLFNLALGPPTLNPALAVSAGEKQPKHVGKCHKFEKNST